MSKTAPREVSKVLQWTHIITSIYLSLIILYMRSNSLFLKWGSSDNIYIIFTIATLEVIKYVVYTVYDKSTKRRVTAKELFKSINVQIVIFITIYIVAVLFGAPAFSHYEQTAMFALLLTTVTALPLTLHLGAEDAISIFLSITYYEGDPVQKMFMLKTRLTLFGAWLGAFPIPLDWNRPWQDWPITCCVGTLIGYTMANWACLLLPLLVNKANKTGKYTL